MDILEILDVFTEEDRKFNREMIQHAKNDENVHMTAHNTTEKSLFSINTDNYFKVVSEILNDYHRKWGII